MSDIEQSITQALDGRDTRLVPFFPYLLQDLEELGASPRVTVDMVKENIMSVFAGTRDNCGSFTVLDLGCGKGDVSIPLAREFGFRVHGFDAHPVFVSWARERAAASGISSLCRFEHGDTRSLVPGISGYNMVILGSIGPILGDFGKTLEKISGCVDKGGYAMIDDGCRKEGVPAGESSLCSFGETAADINRCGFRLVDHYIFPSEEIAFTNKKNNEAIKKRAMELSLTYPDLNMLFMDYVKVQEEESAALENDIICVTWLLEKK